jgi:hypothetical protein
LPDPFLKRHRNGTLVVIGALVLVIGFWVDRAPHLHFYRMYRMKQSMRSLRLPPQSRLLGIDDFNTLEVRGLASIDSIMGIYSTNVDCAVVNAHYKAEFPRQGFSYVNEHTASGTESAQLKFSSPGFSASLSCTRWEELITFQKPATIYMITMTWITPRT